MANDANCFALSEATDGAGAGHDVVFGVIAGTGVGGGVCVHGRVLQGAHAIAGEWGHNPAAARTSSEEVVDAPRCYCGKIGLHRELVQRPGTGRAVSRARLAGR